jgi:Holliday junction resolvase RusA-like endonuclease
VLAAVWVPGVPRTQGSMEHVGGGHMKHSDVLVRWRSLVRDELQRDGRVRGSIPELEYWREESAPLVLEPPFTDRRYRGPVAVRCIFVRGDGLGDIDKLARCVLDALEASKIIADDVQVVKLHCDRVDSIWGMTDGAFVLVATVAGGQGAGDTASLGAEIDGWVSR